jgi:hypothetical protein
VLGYDQQDAAIWRLEAREQTPAGVEVKSADIRNRGASEADACRSASPAADVIDCEV